jgi:hypothetical protein
MLFQGFDIFGGRIEAAVFEVNSDDVASLMRLLKLDTKGRLNAIGSPVQNTPGASMWIAIEVNVVLWGMIFSALHAAQQLS